MQDGVHWAGGRPACRISRPAEYIRTPLETRTQVDVRRVLRRMRSTAGGTPTLPDARHSFFPRVL